MASIKFTSPGTRGHLIEVSYEMIEILKRAVKNAEIGDTLLIEFDSPIVTVLPLKKGSK